jgi:pimeloyl-ACP methyl ester carboxylesterase
MRWPQGNVEEAMSASRQETKLSSGPLTWHVLGQGRPLLYLHAAGGPLISPFLEALAKTHRIYAPTAPGFEGTPAHDAVGSIRALAGLYAEFAKAVIKERCDVMGHSFGGWTALWLAADHPDTVEQIVLEAPGGLRFGAKPAPPLSPEQARKILYAYPDKAANLVKPPEVAAANAKMFGRYNNGMLVDEELVARLPGITARALILMGSKEKMIPAQTGQVLKEKIPASHLAYVYDAAHAIEVDQPERTLRIVKAFLERGESYIVNFGETAVA